MSDKTWSDLDAARCDALNEAGYAEILFLNIVAANVDLLPDLLRAAYQPVLETRAVLLRAEAALRAKRDASAVVSGRSNE